MLRKLITEYHGNSNNMALMTIAVLMNCLVENDELDDYELDDYESDDDEYEESIYVCVEWAGSGKILCNQLEIPSNSSFKKIVKILFNLLPLNLHYSKKPTIFIEHGGPILNESNLAK